MRYPPEETAEKHARILEQASILFRERGFSGVSVSEVMKATGLTHGAFYNHFASKEDLIARSIAEASAKALDKGASSGQSTAQFIDDYLSEPHRDNPGKGCLMAALASEIAHEPAAQGAFTRHVRSLVERIAKPLAKAKKKNARRHAIHTLTSMVGAVILARAIDDPELSEEILRETRAALD